MTKNDLVRFWAKVKKTGPIPRHDKQLGRCWIWTASLNSGYGQLWWPEKNAPELAHRISWLIHHGRLDDADCVLHKCDNRKCVNPSHHFLGDRDDNNQDAMEKGITPHGVKHWNRKLEEEEVRQIRNRRNAARVTFQSMAAEYGVSEATVRDAFYRRSWKHI